MASGSDPYAVLGVARDASEVQIAQARHRLVLKYHPDVNHDPDAAARFDEVQRAFHLLSDLAARAAYDRAHDEQGRARMARATDGGYDVDGAAAELIIQPTAVDFGLITPERRWADAKVTVAWTGEPPESITRDQGGDWWIVRAAERPNTGCMVFYLRAAGRPGTPNGPQHAQFTVSVGDSVLTVRLTADFQGVFPGASPADRPPLRPDVFRTPDDGFLKPDDLFRKPVVVIPKPVLAIVILMALALFIFIGAMT